MTLRGVDVDGTCQVERLYLMVRGKWMFKYQWPRRCSLKGAASQESVGMQPRRNEASRMGPTLRWPGTQEQDPET